jgi:hypothetical protein
MLTVVKSDVIVAVAKGMNECVNELMKGRLVESSKARLSETGLV